MHFRDPSYHITFTLFTCRSADDGVSLVAHIYTFAPPRYETGLCPYTYCFFFFFFGVASVTRRSDPNSHCCARGVPDFEFEAWEVRRFADLWWFGSCRSILWFVASAQVTATEKQKFMP